MKRYKYRICAYTTNPKSAYLDRVRIYRQATVGLGIPSPIIRARNIFLQRYPNQIEEDICWIKLVGTKYVFYNLFIKKGGF